MSFIKYEIFFEVARKKSFAKAAESMNLTPSAISHSISGLEKDLGFPFFTRSRAGVTITKEGQQMLTHVEEILRNEAAMHEEASKINGLTKGTVTIGTFCSVLINWFPNILTSFQNKYPGINVKIKQGDYEDAENLVESGEAEIGFTTINEKNVFDETPVYHDRLLCVVPSYMHPKNGESFTIDEIKNQELILRRTGYNKDLEAFLKTNYKTYDARYQLDDDRAIFVMVEKGLGISILPELTLGRIAFDVNIYPFEPAEYRQIIMITKKHQTLPPAASELKNHILTFIESENAKI